jgi:hypothetical protein
MPSIQTGDWTFALLPNILFVCGAALLQKSFMNQYSGVAMTKTRTRNARRAPFAGRGEATDQAAPAATP